MIVMPLSRELTDGKAYKSEIVTEISQFKAFYPAEEYHRDYYRRNPKQGYCQAVISPKLAKLAKVKLGAPVRSVLPARSMPVIPHSSRTCDPLCLPYKSE